MSTQTPARAPQPRIPKILQKAAEYNLTEHCNLKCAGCDHSSPHLPKKFAEVDQFERDLAALSPVIHLGQLKLLGGEPLLHPDLPEFLRVARASRIADEIAVVTNGVLLHRCDPATFELIDRLSVSIYPGVKLGLDLGELESLSNKHNFKLQLGRINHFRVTNLNRPHRDDLLVRQIFRQCELAHASSCHTVHEGYYFKCSPAAFLTKRMSLIGESVLNRDLDGVKIHDNPRLRTELENYLRDEQPLAACCYCLGSSGRRFAHRQLNNREMRAENRSNEERHNAATAPKRRFSARDAWARLSLVLKHLGIHADGLSDYAIESIANEKVSLGMLAVAAGDRGFAVRCYLKSLRQRPLVLKTYVRLAWAILPSRVAQLLSPMISTQLLRRLSGPRFPQEDQPRHESVGRNTGL